MTLQVASLRRSLDYYEGTLGLRTISQTADTAVLGAADDPTVLVELHARPGARPANRRGSFGLFHFALLLPDCPALGRFLRHALDRRAVSGVSDHAVSEAVYLYDPDGLGIEVYADRDRASWRTTPGGELHMTTEPLDVGGVIAASAGRAWDAAPAGTRMGHVHLHVGDLAEADAFYAKALGFDKTVWTYPGALFFAAGGYHHHVGTNTWAAGGRADDGQAKLLCWDLEVDDPESVRANLERTGRTIERRDGHVMASDPWGTAVRIRASG